MNIDNIDRIKELIARYDELNHWLTVYDTNENAKVRVTVGAASTTVSRENTRKLIEEELDIIKKELEQK